MKYVLAVVLFIGAGALLFSSIRDLIKKIKSRKSKNPKESAKDECESANGIVDCEETRGSQSVSDKADETEDS